jgi:hypothetical protein
VAVVSSVQAVQIVRAGGDGFELTFYLLYRTK